MAEVLGIVAAVGRYLEYTLFQGVPYPRIHCRTALTPIISVGVTEVGCKLSISLYKYSHAVASHEKIIARHVHVPGKTIC